MQISFTGPVDDEEGYTGFIERAITPFLFTQRLVALVADSRGHRTFFPMANRGLTAP